jgi:ferritin-like protein
MGQNSAQLHEDAEVLGAAAIDRHRVIASIMEEFEAVDWYDQRVLATTDESLAAVLAHNRDEEKEHAAMAIEWLRRHDPVWDRVLRTYLFTEEPITEVEHEAEAGGGAAVSGAGGGSLGIGPLMGKELL